MKRVMLALTLALFAGLFIAQLAVADHIPGTTNSTDLATNPELSAARRHVRYTRAIATTAETSESAVLAANPELMAARRYAGVSVAAGMSASAYLAANPELMAVLRYASAANR